MRTRPTKILAFVYAKAMLAVLPAFASDETPTEARTIVKDAYIYGFPLAESYRPIMAQ